MQTNKEAEQVTLSDLGICCGKMFQEPSPADFCLFFVLCHLRLTTFCGSILLIDLFTNRWCQEGLQFLLDHARILSCLD